MRIAQEQFSGIVPRVAPHRLGPSAAQDATNARLLSGDLEAWRQFAAEHRLATSAPVLSIYRLNSAWLSWSADVDAARGPIPGDDTFRLYLTGPTIYSTPRFTNYALATTGAEPYPVTTRPLGVPGPSPFGGPVVLTIYASGVVPTETTAYLYTFVNDLGQESAPSGANSVDSGPLTTTILLYAPTGEGNGNSIIIEAPSTGIPVDYNIVAARIYRAATGATGTVFRFLTELPAASLPATYADFVVTSRLGAELQTETWDLPPDDLQGLLALPNGIMAGFSGNQLCLSAQNYPHAWPVGNRYATDTDIVGIGNIDTTVVVFTKSFLYVASGNDPAQYGMAKFEVPYAGVSKRSIAYLSGVGVVGATPDGLRAVAGIGQSANLTSAIFTRQQWQALSPTSILGIAHDSIYFMFYDTGAPGGRGGYAIDGATTGFGMISLSFHATAVYNDPETDELFLVLDSLNEPTDALLPLESTAPAVDGVTIFEFDSPNGTGNLAYRYRGRLNQLAIPLAPLAAQLRAGDFTNLIWRIYGDGVQIFEAVIANGVEFTLPDLGGTYRTIEFELVGTSRVRNAQVGEDMEDLQ